MRDHTEFFENVTLQRFIFIFRQLVSRDPEKFTTFLWLLVLLYEKSLGELKPYDFIAASSDLESSVRGLNSFLNKATPYKVRKELSLKVGFHHFELIVDRAKRQLVVEGYRHRNRFARAPIIFLEDNSLVIDMEGFNEYFEFSDEFLNRLRRQQASDDLFTDLKIEIGHEPTRQDVLMFTHYLRSLSLYFAETWEKRGVGEEHEFLHPTPRKLLFEMVKNSVRYEPMVEALDQTLKHFRRSQDEAILAVANYIETKAIPLLLDGENAAEYEALKALIENEGNRPELRSTLKEEEPLPLKVDYNVGGLSPDAERITEGVEVASSTRFEMQVAPQIQADAATAIERQLTTKVLSSWIADSDVVDALRQNFRINPHVPSGATDTLSTIIPYERSLVDDVLKKVAELSDDQGKVIVLVENSDQWREAHRLYGGRLVIGFRSQLEQMVRVERKRLAAESILHVVAENSKLAKETVRDAYLGAIALGQVQVLGFEEASLVNSRRLTISEILKAVNAATRAIAQSA